MGTIRNHACETIPLSQTITNYTKNLEALNFNNCPEKFSLAFKAHIRAWNNMKKVTDKHDTIRGELHYLFNKLEQTKDSVEFKIYLKDIWDTWKVIENAKVN